MPTITHTYKKGETPPPLTPEQKAMLARLKDLPDSEIDMNDDLLPLYNKGISSNLSPVRKR